MSKKLNPELPDSDNPEWTEKDTANAVRLSALPVSLQTKLRKRGRPFADQTKERISIRLSPEIVKRFKATGPGWQTRMDAALSDWLKQHSPDELNV